MLVSPSFESHLHSHQGNLMDINKSVQKIADEFRKVDCKGIFTDLGLEKFIVKRKDDTPMFVPCLPVVGKNYKEGGILVLATAQNWEDGRKSECESYRQWPNERIEEIDDYRGVKIQPWKDGVLPALVAMYLSAKGGDPAMKLETIASQCAVTNFFKFSLRKLDHRSRDMNPCKLHKAVREKYVQCTFDCFVQAELRILQPKVVISFARPDPKIELLKGWRQGVFVKPIDDPACIKCGMRKERWPHSRSAPDFLDGYLREMDPRYSAGKKDTTTSYLLHYLEAWRVD
jgi:hypothetical protein